MPERLIALLEVGASLSSRYADWLRLISATAAAYNALHLSGALGWTWRVILKICGPCWGVARWLRNV